MIYILIITYCMRHFGPLQGTNVMIFVSSLTHVRSSNFQFEIMLEEENLPMNKYLWKHDRAYAYSSSYRMTMPFKQFGFALGAVLQIFLPIKLILLWKVLYMIYFVKDIME